MKKLTLVLSLLLLAIGIQSVNAQCHMSRNQIGPIIDRYNPFFTDHTWDDKTKTETAMLDPFRILVIRQKACKRHHVLFSLHVDKSEVVNSDRFWITELLVMMKRVYFAQPTYLEYQERFEKEFIRQFLANGLNKTFTFPVDDRTFICLIEHGDWGAKLRMESVKFILRERVKQPGIARDADDGWFKAKN